MNQTNQRSIRLFYIQSSWGNLKNPLFNVLWSFSCAFFERRTSRSGYMSVITDGQPLRKPAVTIMLPMINLSSTNKIALHSLLCFVVEQNQKYQVAYTFHHIWPTVICKGLRNCNVIQDVDFWTSRCLSTDDELFGIYCFWWKKVTWE